MSDWDTNKIAQSRWNRIHASYEREELAYDGWLDSFRQVIINCQTPIIDLGCGSGNDTLYLVKLGKEVIPCDYSENAIHNIRKNFPEVRRSECVDLTEGLPFPDSFAGIILADLSLHYFDEMTTFGILDDLKRVLKPAGLLLFRVNSIHDINYGAGQGIEIERHFYKTETMGYKRFFDESDIRHFFHGWELIHVEESELDRFEKPKVLWTGAARNLDLSKKDVIE